MVRTSHVRLNFTVSKSLVVPFNSTICPRNGPKRCQKAPKSAQCAPTPRNQARAISWATWLKTEFRGHIVHPQPSTFCGFQASDSPNETPRPPYKWSLGTAGGQPGPCTAGASGGSPGSAGRKIGVRGGANRRITPGPHSKPFGGARQRWWIWVHQGGGHLSAFPQPTHNTTWGLSQKLTCGGPGRGRQVGRCPFKSAQFWAKNSHFSPKIAPETHRHSLNQMIV